MSKNLLTAVEGLVQLKYGEFRVLHAVALDLVRIVLICWEICLIWDLAGFHFLVPKLYANLVLAHDLIEAVLTCWFDLGSCRISPLGVKDVLELHST